MARAEKTQYGKLMEQRRREGLRPKDGHKHPGICGAKKRKGGKCEKPKGWGTDHVGIGKCKYHGGSVPNHRLNAAKQEAVLMGAPMEINPVDALYWCIKLTAGEVEFLSDQISQIDKEDWYEHSILGKQMNLLVRERKEAVERLEKFSKDAISLGLAERAVRLAENYGVALARLLHGVLDDLDLSAAQKDKVPSVIRKHMLLLEGHSPIKPDERTAIEGTAKRAA